MLGKARSGCMKFCSISGILLGQFSAGRLEHSVKPFGKGRGSGLRNTVEWATGLIFFYSFLSLPSSDPPILHRSVRSVLCVCPLPCVPNSPHAAHLLWALSPCFWTSHLASFQLSVPLHPPCTSTQKCTVFLALKSEILHKPLSSIIWGNY